MDRNELYKVAKQLGLPVNSTMTKPEFCAAVSTYALSKVGDFRQIFSNWSTSGSSKSGKPQKGGLSRKARSNQLKGGYFDPVLNQQIDEDIGEGDEDFADDLYDYDSDMDDQDIEDDNGDDDDDEDETGYEVQNVQNGGYQNKDKRPRPIRSRLQTRKASEQIGGGNFEVLVPIGYVHRSYIGRLFKELPNIRAGAKARLEFREDKKNSDKNYATGSVWIVTQNQALLEELRRKTAEFITELEEENLRKNPGSSSKGVRSSKGSSANIGSRGAMRELAGYEDTVKLPGPIHKRFVGELIKSFADLKKEGFETAKLQYVGISGDESNIGMGYVQVWSPNSQDEAKALGDRVEKQITRLFQRADKEKAEAVEKSKAYAAAKTKGTRNIADELRGPRSTFGSPSESSRSSSTSTSASTASTSASAKKPSSPRSSKATTSSSAIQAPTDSWADLSDDEEIKMPIWTPTTVSTVSTATKSAWDDED